MQVRCSGMSCGCIYVYGAQLNFPYFFVPIVGGVCNDACFVRVFFFRHRLREIS